jgi:hypothetical protein
MLESNEQAVAALRHRFAAELADASAVLVHFTLLPDTPPAALPPNCRPFLRSCSHLVSELLGVAGDNEFMPELLAAARRLFLARGGLCLPETYTLWAAPLQCPTLHAAVRSLHRCHITGVPPEGKLLAPARALYSHRCDEAPDRRGIAATAAWALPSMEGSRGEEDGKLTADDADATDADATDACATGVDVVEPVLHSAGWPAPAMASPPWLCDTGTCHGFLIWFTSRLYKDVVIDSRHSSPARNAFHWEAWVLPVAPVAIGPASGGRAEMGMAVGEGVTVKHLSFELRRTVRPVNETQRVEPQVGPQRLRLSYSWRCQGGPWHNVAGEEDGVEIGPIASLDYSRPGQAGDLST